MDIDSHRNFEDWVCEEFTKLVHTPNFRSSKVAERRGLVRGIKRI